MRHYLITRFNTGLYRRKGQKTRRGAVIEPEKWMIERFRLFEKYTVPSILNQSCKDFTWLVGFDRATPMAYIMRAKEYCTVLLGDNTRQEAIKHIGSGGTVITSRVDNDDALHTDYIGNVQSFYHRKQRSGIYVFPVGWIYKPSGDKLYHVRYPRNPFLSRVEKNVKNLKTVYEWGHVELFKKKAVKFTRIEGKGHMWLQVIHKSNLANKTWGDRKDISKLNKRDFGA